MLLYIKDIARARQAAKSLKLNLDDWGVNRPLTWHQETVAKMLGHTDWKALNASVNEGMPPSIQDEDVEHAELTRRRDYQARVLIERVGADAVKHCGGKDDVFVTIARHVAPSGRPNAGTAYKTTTGLIDENGVVTLPLSLDLWTEDAIFCWRDLPIRKDLEHITRTFDPEAEEFYRLFEGHYDPAVAERCLLFIASKPADNLSKLALLARGARSGGHLDEAKMAIEDAFNIGSCAWAPVARERRRLHNPVRWWEEPETRPFMHVLYELAMVDVFLATEDSLNSALSVLRALLALNPSDPLKATQTLESVFGFDPDAR